LKTSGQDFSLSVHSQFTFCECSTAISAENTRVDTSFFNIVDLIAGFCASPYGGGLETLPPRVEAQGTVFAPG